MKTTKFVIAILALALAGCGPPPPPSVDPNARGPVNSAKTEQGIALQSSLVTRKLINGGDRQVPTADEQYARMRSQIAYLDDKLHRHGVAYDQTVFIAVKDGQIMPDAGQQTQLTTSLKVTRSIEVTASSAELAEQTRNYLISRGAAPTCITVAVSNFSPSYVAVMMTYF